jgi:hypothetical protein
LHFRRVRRFGKSESLWSKTVYVRRFVESDGSLDQVMFTPNNTIRAMLAE